MGMTPEGERGPKKKISGKLEKRGFVRKKGELMEEECQMTERAKGVGNGHSERSDIGGSNR